MNLSCDDDSASVNASVVRLADGKRPREQTDLLQTASVRDQAFLLLSRTSSCDSTRTAANALVIYIVTPHCRLTCSASLKCFANSLATSLFPLSARSSLVFNISA